jgi:hypothetical protein
LLANNQCNNLLFSVVSSCKNSIGHSTDAFVGGGKLFGPAVFLRKKPTVHFGPRRRRLRVEVRLLFISFSQIVTDLEKIANILGRSRTTAKFCITVNRLWRFGRMLDWMNGLWPPPVPHHRKKNRQKTEAGGNEQPEPQFRKWLLKHKNNKVLKSEFQI